MRAANLKFLAQCRGNRFEVSVRGLKGYYALLLCPYALVKGDRLVLSPLEAGTTAAFSRLQLFARVLVPHPDRGVYETIWEKLVSPPGLTVLMEYLQSNLGVCIASSHMNDDSWAYQELAYFDFASATVNFPSRGQCPAQRVDSVQYARTVGSMPAVAPPSVPPASRDPSFSSAVRRAPIPTPSNPIRSGSFVPVSPARPGQPTGRPAPQPARSMYGMDVSEDEMDLAEQISAKQTSASKGTAVPRPGPAVPVAEDPNEGKGGFRGTVTTLIRSLASHMSDDDPFSGGGNK